MIRSKVKGEDGEKDQRAAQDHVGGHGRGPDCGAALAASTRPQVVPPQGPVRQVIFKNCTNCHGIDDYAYNALDRAGWDTLLTTKHRDMNVSVPAQDRALLLDWLAMRFGPTTKPFPRATSRGK